MRNTFNELIKAGVASFHHEPIVPDQPSSIAATPESRMARIYNMYWGAATDSHMSISQEGRLLITGRITQNPTKWIVLMHCDSLGGINWCQSGYCSLADLLQANGKKAVPTIHNGERGFEIVPWEPESAQLTAPKTVTTTESKIPQPIQILGSKDAIQDIFEASHNVIQLAENLNDSRVIVGDKWFAYENTLVCPYGRTMYIMEVNVDAGNIIQDEEFVKLMKDEGLEALKLVQYDKYFRLESDDKKWSVLLNKWRDNKIKEKSFEAMTPEEWVDHIKWMLSTLN